MSAAAPATELPRRRWRFGTLVLDEHTRELQRDGQAVPLERKPLEVLIFLLHRAGEVVTKEELAEAVWPGRILTETVLTKAIFKLRQALGDEDQAIVKTVHGYGYRLVAPLTVESPSTAAPLSPRFDFKPGDVPPLRPLWRLVECLGTGGHGEVWLARHDKTRESRVYKYALEGTAFTALKREVTLFRLLHDSLGERPDLVRILDWNLQEPPFFIESEYTAGGSLMTWAGAQGGIDKVPMRTRLDLLAQTAEILAAAHSVGVLHKDLKPGNVLIEAIGGEPPRVKLTDFGSGAMLDPARLAALGITRLGFTQSAAAPDTTTSGTLHYLSPEVLAGQPPTVQADIYALGVMLYQLVVGDLRKPLSAGWEHDVADELLREDIALAADGNPSRRLADAGLFAQRLRTLEERRAQRSAELAAHAELARARAAEQRAQLVLDRLRVRRAWMLTALGASLIGMSASLWLYLDSRRARNDALASAATTKAVSDFLNQDLLASVDTGANPTKDLTVKGLLDQAASTVDKRFADQPEAAAQVHYSVGSSYFGLGLFEQGGTQFNQALGLFEKLEGRHGEHTLETLRNLAVIADMQDRHAESVALYDEVLGQWERRFGAHQTKVMELRPEVAWANFNAGAFQAATDQLRTFIEDTSKTAGADPRMLASARSRLGSFLNALGHYDEAEPLMRQVVAEQSKLLGDNQLETSVSRMIHGSALMDLGRTDEAETELLAADAAIHKWVGPEDPFIATSGTYLARLRLEQNRPGEAETLLKHAIRIREASFGPDTSIVGWTRHMLAEVYQRQGRLKEAEASMAQALAVGEKVDGASHPFSLKQRVGLADILREQGDFVRAGATLRAIALSTVAGLPDRHPFLANLRREEGLLWLNEKQYDKARAALTEALQIYQLRHGSEHWRTLRARAELAKAG